MKKAFSVLAFTLVSLLVLDSLVALTLNWAERSGRLGSLVQYFDYGRSVPGKLQKWETTPGAGGNLYDVAWRDDQVAESATRFAAETDPNVPVIRSYGMSFVNHIIRKAVEADQTLTWDSHAGPGAPPNFTYAMFEDDRDFRRSGDIAVLGILSSSVPGMAALSNQTWVFEQPAPFTYPIYWPEGDGLRRVDPLVQSATQHRTLAENPSALADWHNQLSREDYFFSWQTFEAIWADKSPFARLVRRSLATSHVDQTKADIANSDDYPYAEVLGRMVATFATTARSDGQIPIVMLIQSNHPGDADVLAVTTAILQEMGILYLATSEHVDPRDPSKFIPDGHYTPEVDQLFAEQFLELIHNLEPN